MMQKVTERPGVTNHLRIAAYPALVCGLWKTSPMSLTGNANGTYLHCRIGSP